jgi:hypothetical protein
MAQFKQAKDRSLKDLTSSLDALIKSKPKADITVESLVDLVQKEQKNNPMAMMMPSGDLKAAATFLTATRELSLSPSEMND